MIKNNRGITLIALVITIIVLLILAGVTISLVLGQNGIVTKAQIAKEVQAQVEAEEKLAIGLLELGTDKYTKKEYNEKEYIDSYLTKKGMVVTGDIVLVDGWKFQIDRSVPKISGRLGQGSLKEQIKLKLMSTTSSDYSKATIHIEIEYEGEIESIEVSRENVTVPTKVDGKYIVDKQVAANGIYTIVIKDKEGAYQVGAIEIKDLTENMDIYTKSDLEAFRDSVNSGRTYAGKTIKVMADIDLENETNQWIPIGNQAASSKLYFAGAFDGNNYTISNISINNSDKFQGLFGAVTGGSVSNTKLKGATIKANECVGGIAGSIKDATISNCSFNGTIGATYKAGGMAGNSLNSQVTNSVSNGSISVDTYNAGGICGEIYQGNVKDCQNNAQIKSGLGNSGGIVGYARGENSNKVKIEYSYNLGIVESLASQAGGICGNVADTEIYYCYNNNIVTGSYFVGGILGYGTSIKISYVINDGKINGTSKFTDNNSYAGGIVGNCDTTVESENQIEYVYNSAQVHGKYYVVAGICGGSWGSSAKRFKISFVYNSGNVTSNAGTTSSLIGAANYTTLQKGYYSSTPNTHIGYNGSGNVFESQFVAKLQIPEEIMKVKQHFTQ